MKEERFRRTILMPHDLNAWLMHEAKKDGRSVTNMLNKFLEEIRNEKALSASTLKALDVNQTAKV